LISLGEDAHLILSSGEYNIDRWMFLGDDATVTYDMANGPVQINLGVWQALNRQNLKFIIAGQGDAKNVIYNYGGKQKCSFRGSFIQGRIIAPKAEIEFSDGTVLEGSCYAAKVNFKTGSSFKGLEYLKPLKINSDCQNLLIPGETSNLKSGVIAQDNQSGEQIILNDRTDGKLKVYPNPTKGSVTISGLPEDSKVQIKIYNSTGKLIKQLISNSAEMQINLENQSPGLFFMKIEGFSSFTVIKI
jgi:hypothetical protein